MWPTESIVMLAFPIFWGLELGGCFVAIVGLRYEELIPYKGRNLKGRRERRISKTQNPRKHAISELFTLFLAGVDLSLKASLGNFKWEPHFLPVLFIVFLTKRFSVGFPIASEFSGLNFRLKPWFFSINFRPLHFSLWVASLSDSHSYCGTDGIEDVKVLLWAKAEPNSSATYFRRTEVPGFRTNSKWVQSETPSKRGETH